MTPPPAAHRRAGRLVVSGDAKEPAFSGLLGSLADGPTESIERVNERGGKVIVAAKLRQEDAWLMRECRTKVIQKGAFAIWHRELRTRKESNPRQQSLPDDVDRSQGVFKRPVVAIGKQHDA
jgi:hypothetical protein